MDHKQGTFQGAGNVALFYQKWLPENKSVATIIIIHGGGEHSNRYMNVVNYFIFRQYAIYSYDLRGHGRSPGQRGHINYWDEFREDLTAFIKLVIKEKPDNPIFLLAQSVGGIIALDYCLHRPKGIKGVICTSPAIGKIGVPEILWKIGRIFDRIWPNCPFSTGLEISKLSRDPFIIEETKTDPLYHRKATPRLGMQIELTVDWIHAHAGDFCFPLLILHGTEDEIAFIEGSRKFISNVTYPDAHLQEYEGGYHELYNDIIKDQVLEDIEHWLSDHMKQTG